MVQLVGEPEMHLVNAVPRINEQDVKAYLLASRDSPLVVPDANSGEWRIMP